MAETREHLSALEASGLIRPAQLEPELEYLFKHALVQDATYASILKQDRKALHGAVGSVLEQLYADRLDEVAAVLGLHFDEAQDDAQALKYFTLAGEAAAAKYALEVAATQFTRALAVARRSGAPHAALLRKRGQARDTLGQFDLARQDYEQAIAQARAEHDRAAEWHALLDLGLLWASRDYGRTGEYLRQAHALAQIANDPAMRAHSLNRLGNWHMNTGNPALASRHHLEALAIFDSLNDAAGRAATSDLLGMTNAILGRFDDSRRHYGQAIGLFEQVGDQQGLASSLSMMAWMSAMLPDDNADWEAQAGAGLAHARRAVQVTRAIGWRSGEAYALLSCGVVEIAAGWVRQGLDSLTAALALAESIEHRQWTLAANYGLGHAHYGLFDLDSASRYFEAALDIAVEIDSLHWRRQIGGPLALVLIDLKNVERAARILESIDGDRASLDDINSRNVYHAAGELALARGDADRALRHAETLLSVSDTLLALGPNNVVRLTQLKTKALCALNREPEAVRALDSFLRRAEQGPWKHLSWPARIDLARLYRAAGRPAEAGAQLARARDSVFQIAAGCPAGGLREGFVRRALTALEG